VPSLADLAVVIAQQGPRGDAPDEGGGLLVIAAVIVGIIVVAIVLWTVVRRSHNREREGVGRKDRHDRGDVGRI
jgi:hypothetical protein